MKEKMNQEIERKYIIIFLFISLGIMLRYWVMTFNHTFDFESYCIVGDLVGHMQNVYANTTRYNYGPIFFGVLGLLYKISFFIQRNQEWTYRVLVVSVLTLADLGIAFFIADRKDIKHSLMFFLNPVSIIITGFHNQFDNIAILLALCSLYFYNEDDKFVKKDVLFILFMSLSLMTKHILFLIPVFILVKKDLPIKKKLLYAIVPPAVFLVSFIPFALSSREAFNGILNNVFLYRSSNNAPLLHYFYELINFSKNLQLYVFVILMCITGFIVRKSEFDYCLMIYLISVVAFSSAIANQYLVIPLAALCMLELDMWNYIYSITMTVFLYFNEHGGLAKLWGIQRQYPDSWGRILGFYDLNGYTIATWILFITLVYEVISKKRSNKLSRN